MEEETLFEELFLNVTLMDSDDEPGFEGLNPRDVLFVLYAITVVLVSLVGNPLVVFLGLRHVKLSIVPYFYVLNLALANSLLVPYFGILVFASVLGLGVGRLSCVLFGLLSGLRPVASWLVLFVMTFDRYLVHYHPVYYKWRELKNAKILMGVVWILSGLYVLPLIIHELEEEDGYSFLSQCDLEIVDSHTLLAVISRTFEVLTLIIFLLVVAKSGRSRCRTKSGGGAANSLFRPHNDDSCGRVNRFIVVLISLCLILPLITNLYRVLTWLIEEQASGTVPVEIKEGVFFLRNCEPMIVPIVCLVMASEYREGLSRWICCRKPEDAPQICYTRQSDMDPEAAADGDLLVH